MEIADGVFREEALREVLIALLDECRGAAREGHDLLLRRGTSCRRSAFSALGNTCCMSDTCERRFVDRMRCLLAAFCGARRSGPIARRWKM